MKDQLIASQSIMEEYLKQTGVLNATQENKRYLWTDAFAVMNLIALAQRSDSALYEKWAKMLVDKVHSTLGRHRSDDTQGRQGWISGLSEEEGAKHPTAGGLRIGKNLPERQLHEKLDEDAEWDKDGQYYHYLTKWMRALVQMARHFHDHHYLLQAFELATKAHERFLFVPSSAGSGPVGREMHWKMSIDLSHSQTYQMGSLDPLDGFLTYLEIEMASIVHFKDVEPLSLERQRNQLFGIIHNTGITDPLGLGGILFDLTRVCKALHIFSSPGQLEFVSDHSIYVQHIRQQLLELLTGLVKTTCVSLEQFDSHSLFTRKAESRLAFREFGLAFGLLSLRQLGGAHEPSSLLTELTIPEQLKAQIQGLLTHVPMADTILTFWTQPGHQAGHLWMEHRHINSVMLATCLLEASQMPS